VHEAFTGRLDLAIDQQAQLAEQLVELRTQREEALAQRQRRLKAFETLQARRETAAQQRAQRNDQRQTDEFATQAYLRQQRKGRNP
jgi:flagellar FliJ protein